jgi:hypothetical protein
MGATTRDDDASPRGRPGGHNARPRNLFAHPRACKGRRAQSPSHLRGHQLCERASGPPRSSGGARAIKLAPRGCALVGFDARPRWLARPRCQEIPTRDHGGSLIPQPEDWPSRDDSLPPQARTLTSTPISNDYIHNLERQRDAVSRRACAQALTARPRAFRLPGFCAATPNTLLAEPLEEPRRRRPTSVGSEFGRLFNGARRRVKYSSCQRFCN